jgi:hypothetical protein
MVPPVTSGEPAAMAMPASSGSAAQFTARPGVPPREPLDLTYRRADDRPRSSALRERWQRDDSQAPSPLEREMTRAQRRDCRTAYASLGLFAIPKLLLEARGEGCKW